MSDVEKVNALAGVLLASVMLAAAVSNALDPFSIVRFIAIRIMWLLGAM